MVYVRIFYIIMFPLSITSMSCNPNGTQTISECPEGYYWHALDYQEFSHCVQCYELCVYGQNIDILLNNSNCYIVKDCQKLLHGAYSSKCDSGFIYDVINDSCDPCEIGCHKMVLQNEMELVCALICPNYNTNNETIISNRTSNNAMTNGNITIGLIVGGFCSLQCAAVIIALRIRLWRKPERSKNDHDMKILKTRTAGSPACSGYTTKINKLNTNTTDAPDTYSIPSDSGQNSDERKHSHGQPMCINQANGMLPNSESHRSPRLVDDDDDEPCLETKLAENKQISINQHMVTPMITHEELSSGNLHTYGLDKEGGFQFQSTHQTKNSEEIMNSHYKSRRNTYNDNRGTYNDNRDNYNDNRDNYYDNRDNYNDNRYNYNDNRGIPSVKSTHKIPGVVTELIDEPISMDIFEDEQNNTATDDDIMLSYTSETRTKPHREFNTYLTSITPTINRYESLTGESLYSYVQPRDSIPDPDNGSRFCSEKTHTSFYSFKETVYIDDDFKDQMGANSKNAPHIKSAEEHGLMTADEIEQLPKDLSDIPDVQTKLQNLAQQQYIKRIISNGRYVKAWYDALDPINAGRFIGQILGLPSKHYGYEYV